MTLNRRHFLTSLAAASVVAPSFAVAKEPTIFQAGGVAINGADPVAYFKTGGPDRVDNLHSVTWKGVEWRFDSAENANAFMNNPKGFAPAFGGYCAFAASRGYLAPTTPEAWTIYQGKLYLNANLRARELWLKDIPGNIAKGQANWPQILG